MEHVQWKMQDVEFRGICSLSHVCATLSDGFETKPINNNNNKKTREFTCEVIKKIKRSHFVNKTAIN